MNARAFLAGFVLLLSPLRATAAAPNVVSDWAAIVQQAIHNPPAPPSRRGGRARPFREPTPMATLTRTRSRRGANALMRDVDDARVYGGLHWRHSMRHGAQIGRRVAAHVTRHYFGVDEEETSR